ncbi:DnaJ family molecular chaperone [Desulfococcus sp.]|uniref:J domain-containing protein n=1 Tax=Desulfococcus sp. TaxID=2025834 RepID=UPI003593BFDA
MASLLNRFYRIAKAAIPRPWVRFREGAAGETGPGNGASLDGDPRFKAKEGAGSASSDGGVPPKVEEDLAVFGLVPPASLEAVRKARNREVKKYHSDRFIDDPERFKTSKEIMQILNAAYDRLEAHYQKKKP